MKKILITGGTGFIASNLIKLLLKNSLEYLFIHMIIAILVPKKNSIKYVYEIY